MQHYGGVNQEVLEVGRGAGREGGRRSTRSPAFWWTLGGVFLVVFSVLATSAMVLFAAQTVQANRLFTMVEASERAMGFVQADVAAVFAEFEEPDITDERREELVERLRTIAAEGEVSISLEGERIAELPIWSVNTRVEEARAAYLRHNAAWVDYLARAAEDPAQFVTPQADVNDTFFDARSPLTRAIPALDPLGLRGRLDRIYAETEGGSDNQTQT